MVVDLLCFFKNIGRHDDDSIFYYFLHIYLQNSLLVTVHWKPMLKQQETTKVRNPLLRLWRSHYDEFCGRQLSWLIRSCIPEDSVIEITYLIYLRCYSLLQRGMLSTFTFIRNSTSGSRCDGTDLMSPISLIFYLPCRLLIS